MYRPHSFFLSLSNEAAARRVVYLYDTGSEESHKHVQFRTYLKNGDCSFSISRSVLLGCSLRGLRLRATAVVVIVIAQSFL